MLQEWTGEYVKEILQIEIIIKYIVWILKRSLNT